MRAEGKYNADYTIEDVYKFYKAQCKEKGTEPIDITVFRKIIKYYNQEVCKSIVYNNDEFRLPFRLGYLRIKKYKTKFKIDKDGNLKTSYLKPDWKATKELWEKNEEAKENKKIVYHTNRHTSGFYYKWFWDKRVCNIKNSSVYSLVMTRGNKRMIPEAVKNNEDIDYFE